MNTKREIGFFKAPILSFFSKKLYKDICYNWKGIGLIYIFCISIIIAGITSWKISSAMDDFSQNDLDKIMLEIPGFQINNGKFSSNVPQPHIMDWGVDEEEKINEPYKVVIDTTGQFTELKDDMVALITTKEFIYRKNTNTIESYVFKDVKSFKMTKEEIRNVFVQVIEYTPMVIGIFVLIGISIWYIIRLIFYSAIITAIIDDKRGFKQIARVTAYALTPGICLDYFTNLSFWVIFVVNICYSIFAIRACKTEILEPKTDLID